MTTLTQLDARDTEILADRTHAFEQVAGPRVGDYVRFADDVTRRISYIWRDEHDQAFNVQTSKGGSFHLSRFGYVSFSGSLHNGVAPETLSDTGRRMLGSVWFFHHDQRMAHNGLDTEIPFRIYRCSEVAPR
jgi:hypothetical protein